jgi:MFS family permease
MVLIVGGIFGMVGFLIQYIVGPVIGPVVFGGLLGEGAAGWTDTVAFTVMLSGIIVRLVFGKTGLTGKTPAGEKREWIATGSRLGFVLTYGAGIGILIGGVAAALGTLGLVDGVAEAAYLFSMTPVIGFAIAAFSLILIMCGVYFEGWHHIVLPSGTTAVLVFTATLNPFAAIIGGAITGMFTAFVGEWAAKTLNSHCDTHIDPPAVTIFITQLINTVIIGGLILV